MIDGEGASTMTSTDATTGSVAEPAAPVHWHHETSWDELEVQELPNGIRNRRFLISAEKDPSAPIVFWTYFPPNVTTPPHTHECDYAEIILSGSQQVTRRWYKAGDVRIVKAGTVYGPLVSGPEGATVLVIFRSANWEPIPARASDVEGLFLGMHESIVDER